MQRSRGSTSATISYGVRQVLSFIAVPFLLIAHQNVEQKTGSSSLAESIAYFDSCSKALERKDVSQAQKYCDLAQKSSLKIEPTERESATAFLSKLVSTSQEVSKAERLVRDRVKAIHHFLRSARLESAVKALVSIEEFEGDERVVRARTQVELKEKEFDALVARARELQQSGNQGDAEELYRQAQKLNRERSPGKKNRRGRD